MTNCRSDPIEPPNEMGENLVLCCLGRHQVKRVNRAGLSHSIDSPHALLEAHRVPGQLVIDDPATACVQVEPRACDIGRQEQPYMTGVEIPLDLQAFRVSHVAVKDRRPTTQSDSRGEIEQRVTYSVKTVSRIP